MKVWKIWNSFVDFTLTARIATIIISTLAVFISSCQQKIDDQTKEKHNIVIILGDEMGYGDIEALNPKSKIPTLHQNKLALQGMILTDAHSNSAICTPSRYGLLTGRYCFHTRLKNIFDFLTGKKATSPRETFYYYEREQLQAVRKGKWKLHLPMNNRYVYFWKEDTFDMPALLYNIDHDFAEQNNQVKERKDKLQELLALAERARSDLGDKGIPCINCREAGYVYE